MASSSIGIALAGLGTVGRAALELFLKKRADMESHLGTRLNLRWICDHDPAKKSKGLKLPAGVQTARTLHPILSDPGVDIVIELIGGLEAARSLALNSIRKRKHVITANKLLLATSWNEIFSKAARYGAHVFYEAAVAGGIPIIRSIREGLVSSRISAIHGILNGTTNFILTRMIHDRMPYRDALKKAQALGFAEADPRLDVNGTDTAHKLSILSSLTDGAWVPPDRIWRQGIEDLDQADVLFARQHLGLTVRLLGIFQRAPSGKIAVRVHPCLLSVEHPFATVHDEYNAIWLETDAAGDLYFHGKGAGAYPAASAVLSDLFDLSRLILSQAPVPKTLHHLKAAAIEPAGQSRSAYYLRFRALDRPGVLAHIASALGSQKISIAQIYQGNVPGLKIPPRTAAVIVITHQASEQAITLALKTFKKSGAKAEAVSLLRIQKKNAG